MSCSPTDGSAESLLAEFTDIRRGRDAAQAENAKLRAQVERLEGQLTQERAWAIERTACLALYQAKVSRLRAAIMQALGRHADSCECVTCAALRETEDKP